MSNLFVCALGVGTVFFSLICIIVICYVMSSLCKIFSKPISAEKTTVINSAPEKIENKQEIIAAVTCAIAEELGEDIKGIRVKSFKRV